MFLRYKLWFGLPIAMGLMLLPVSGCGEKDHDDHAEVVDAHAGHNHAGHAHEEGESSSAGEWCSEHDAPEALCTKCNPKLIDEFKAKGDWCGTHDVPESQCLLCNPELKAKFAATRPAVAKPAASGDVVVEQWRPSLRKSNDPNCDVESNQVRLLDPTIAVKAGIVVQPATRRRMSATVTCSAEVRYNQTQLAHITPRAPGVVAEVPVGLGDTVEEGDLLAVIESAVLGQTKSSYIEARETYLIAKADMDRHKTIHEALKVMLQVCEEHTTSDQLRKKYAETRIGDAKSRLLTAHAELELVRQRFDREKNLADKGIASQESLQAAKANLDKAEAGFAATHEAIDIEMEKEHMALERALTVARVALDAARRHLLIAGVSASQIESLDAGKDETLGRYELRSPIKGTVVNLRAVVGESATTETAVVSVADLASMWLMLSLEERDLVVVKLGQPVLFAVDGLIGRRFQGKLDWISSEVDDRTRTVQARVALTNPDRLLRANMFGAAQVVARDDDEVLAIPDDAIQSDSCCSLVFVQQSDTLYRPRKVALGVAAKGYIEVLDGLAEGDLVVTTGSFLMKTEILKGSIGAGCCEVDPGR